ncbi:hypothetical protein GCM10029964_043970 [Kibdelosporangium lantanae]
MVSMRRIFATALLSASLIAPTAAAANAATAQPMGSGYNRCLNAHRCVSSEGYASAGRVFIDFVLDNGNGYATIGGYHCSGGFCGKCWEESHDLPCGEPSTAVTR